MQKARKSNIGDGFILRRILQMLHPHECQHIFTSRKNLSADDIRKINDTKGLILAGTNQLTDNFSIVPGLTLKQLSMIKVPIIPFAIGINGHRKENMGISDFTKTVLNEIHNRIQYSSWRCSMTIDYLVKNVPSIEPKLLMTGCPVIYDKDLLSGLPFSNKTGKIVVTVTDRDDFWEREVKTMDFVSHRFKDSEKILSLHQVFEGPTMWNFVRSFIGRRKIYRHKKKVIALRAYAKERGFHIFVPKNVEECWNFYRSCDMHMGSRLHAHLFFLSQAKKSFLTYVDERMTGFSHDLGFPLCDYRSFDAYLEYDFEIYRANCIRFHQTMQRFITYLKDEIL
jgi:hypothetical protein